MLWRQCAGEAEILRRIIASFVLGVFLLGGYSTAEAFPSRVHEREDALAWIVGGVLVATFPKSMEEDLVSMVLFFNNKYKKGFPLSDLRIESRKDQWHIALSGEVLLPVTATACRFHRSKESSLAVQWLSNLHEALVSLSSAAQRKEVTLDGQVRTKGKVSWYGGSAWEGRKTASGELFDDRQLTAAAKDLPFGTLLRLSDAAGNRSVTVRVSDRFKGHKDRLLDISRAAAEFLGIKKCGIADLTIEILGSMSRVGGSR